MKVYEQIRLLEQIWQKLSQKKETHDKGVETNGVLFNQIILLRYKTLHSDATSAGWAKTELF